MALDADNRYRNDIGLQLYTLRNPIGEDVGGTLKTVAEAGYHHVEPFGFPDCDHIINAAKDAGLPIHSSHFNSDGVIGNDDAGGSAFEAVVGKAKDVGMTHLVIPYLADQYRQSLDDYRRLVDRCNRAAEVAKKAGIQLAYHNHAFEFDPLGENGECGYDIMRERFTDDMMFEVDVFWVQVAGIQPAKLLREMSGRISQLHLKDLSASAPTPSYGGVPNEAFEEIGDGVVDIRGIMEMAADLGVKHAHVEQDQSPHPIESVRQSIEAIRRMG